MKVLSNSNNNNNNNNNSNNKLHNKWKSSKRSYLKFDLNNDKSSFNPLKTKQTWNLFKDSAHSAQQVRTVSVVKIIYLVPYREIIAASSEIHTEHTLSAECGIFEY
jgi:hypothetical protein